MARTLLEGKASRCGCLAALALLAMVLPARAQIRASGGNDSSTADQNIFLPADRGTLQKLADAKKLLAEGRLGEAVRYLGDLLDGPEDFFYQPDKDSPLHHSLKAEVQRLIGGMPREGRDLYELHGARARRMLEEALQSGNAERLAEVSRRFFHTRSGYQATFLLGLDHLDRGRPLAGALILQRLREAGEPAEAFEPTLSLAMAACWLQAGSAEKVRDALVALRKQQPAAQVVVAGRPTPLWDDNAKAADWLLGLIGRLPAAGAIERGDWPMFRGDATRNASSPGGAPLLNIRWQIPSTDDQSAIDELTQMRRMWTEQGQPMMSAFHPLAIGDVLLMRTLRNLLAVDLATGKRLWESTAPADDSEVSTMIGGRQSRQQQNGLMMAIEHRIRDDLTYGTLSSDGQLVFAVEDSDLDGGEGALVNRVMRRAQFGMNGPTQTIPSNRLAAYEIGKAEKGGKLKWQVGGAAGPHALRQAETYFLGPPLPLMGQLYVLAEVKGEIRLVAMEAATGNLLWSQQLAITERSVNQDAVRGWAGGSPSYADGVLVCPTSTGALVGVELATRSLLWGYQYGEDPKARDRARFGGVIPAFAMQRMLSGDTMEHWADAGVCIVDGRVLATPLESPALHCLNLADGKLLWKCPRNEDLYVACADRDQVVLVGRRGVRALRLADGKPAWGGRRVEFAEGSVPSGRGFLSQQHYFLPLSSAEVVAIDLRAGKIVQTSKSRKGNEPGNLICYRGKVVSLGLDGMECYYQLDAALAEIQQRLGANPDDAEALALRGETLLDRGKRDEAIADFRRAYELKADVRSRQLLRDALLEGLQTDFAAYRGRREEVERLLDDPSQQAAYLRVVARGLQQAGELAAAFDCCQKLIDVDRTDRLPLDQAGKFLFTRRDRWIQGQLAAIRGAATGEAAAKIDAEVETRWKATQSGGVESLERFLNYFGAQPSATEARRDLVVRLKAAGRLLDAEMQVWRETPAAELADVAAAVGRLAELFADAGRTADAAACYWWLGRQLADVTGRDGKTGKQWFDAHAEEEAVRHLRTLHETPWPTGNVESNVRPTRNPNQFGIFSLEWRGRRGPFCTDWAMSVNQNGQTIIARDGLGRERWRVTPSQDLNASYNQAWLRADASGHLLLVASGWRLAAIDTLSSGADGGPRILWSRSMAPVGNDWEELRGIPGMGSVSPQQWMQSQYQVAQVYGRSGPLGPVTPRYACFQRMHSVVAIDPLSAAVLWVRQDVPQGSEVFGDDEYVFVVSSEREEAMLLRASDGELLGTRKVPRPRSGDPFGNGDDRTRFARLEDCSLGTLGRRILWWRPARDGNENELALYDPLDGRDVWPRRKFSAGARACLVEDEVVGVLEPSGRFVLLSLPDGRTMQDVELKPERSLVDITMLRSGDQYFLVAHGPPGKPEQVNISPVVHLQNNKLIQRGNLYAMDRQGRLLWPAPAVIKNQFLPPNPPALLPVITFVANRYEQRPNRQKCQVLCIDKRNGRTAYLGDLNAATSIFSLAGDAEKKTIDLTTQPNTVTLSFTDKPIPPPSVAAGDQPAEPPAGGKTIQAIWDSLQKAIGRIAEPPGPDNHP